MIRRVKPVNGIDRKKEIIYQDEALRRRKEGRNNEWKNTATVRKQAVEYLLITLKKKDTAF